MTIDWTQLAAMLSAFAGFAGAGAIVFASIVGKRTVDDWREEKVSERRFDLAEQILVLAYRCRDELAAARNGSINSYEMETSTALLKGRGVAITPRNDDSERKVFAQAVETRLDIPLWSEVEGIRPRCLAYFGKRPVDALDAILDQRRRTRAGILRYYGLTTPPPQSRASILEHFDRRLEDAEHLIMSARIEGREDEIALAMEKAVKGLETELLPVLRSKKDAMAFPAG